MEAHQKPKSDETGGSARRSTMTMTISIGREPFAKQATVPTLRVTSGKDMLRFVALSKGREVVLGREPECDFAIDDGSVSRRHLKVSVDAEGQVELEELGSLNGTFLNGQPVSTAKASPGDFIQVGAVLLRLELLAPEEVAHLERVMIKVNAADCDPLTGLRTRAYVERELGDLVSWESSQGLQVNAIFLDVDHFKSVNDRYGHRVGDLVLRELARLVLVSLRDDDIAVRYGGEEFLIVLPHTFAGAASDIAERLRKHVSTHEWSRVADGLSVTVSLGVATYAAGEDVAAWLDRADRALYTAKAEGRNRVVRTRA